MTKYYRFISEAEYQNLINNKEIKNINNRPFFLLSETPTAYILPNKLNYDITVEQLLTSSYPQKKDFTKEVFLAYMAGTVSEDYLIELTLPSQPAMSCLGWYYNNDDTELCLVEYCIHQYSLDQITNICNGNFYNWQNIETVATKMSLRYDTLMQEKDNPTAKQSFELDIFRSWGGLETNDLAFKEWVIATISGYNNQPIQTIVNKLKTEHITFDI